jgi:hypothetical protein
MRGYRAQTSVECTTVIIVRLMTTRILPRLEWYLMVLVLDLVLFDYLFESVGQFFCPLWGNNPCPLWGNNPCPLWGNNRCFLWDTPHSVVTFSLNLLVWSVVRFWVKL